MSLSPQSELVSVVIPTYNRAHLLQRALRSVLGQTYESLEILVVDDCSVDGTEEVMENFPDPRVRYCRHKTNRGGGAARNTGIRASAGEYIAFLDSDDEWIPDKVERQVQRFRQVPLDVGLVYTGSLRIYDDGRIRPVIPVHRGWILRDVLSHTLITNTSLMIRREVLAAIDGFDEALPAYQDVDFWAQVAEQFRADFVPTPLVRIYIHEDSVRISNDHVRRIRGRQLFYRKHQAAIEREGVSHFLLRETGRIYQRGLFDTDRARDLYRTAIRSNPVDLPSYLFLLSTYLPEPVYRAAAALRRGVVRVAKRFRRLRPPNAIAPSAPLQPDPIESIAGESVSPGRP